MAKKPKRPRDPNQLAKLITDIVSGDRKNDNIDENVHAGQRNGGRKGGKARAVKLSPGARKEIAKKAAQKRWAKN